MPPMSRSTTARGVSTVGRLLAWATVSRGRTLGFVAASLAATGAVDYATGYRYTFSPFYLFPVLIASAALGRPFGLLVAASASAVWTFAQNPPWTAGFSWGLSAWNTLMHFVVLGSVAWLLAALEEEMLAARHDYLTHLFNRRHFMRSVEAERNRSGRSGEPFSVLSVDVDDFKALNDTRGHAVGDEALRVVADLLAGGARTMDVSARTGGDEFCVLLGAADAAVAEEIARRLRSASAEEFRRRGWPLGLSIGIATTRGTSETVDQLLSRADAAMYREKQGHRRRASPDRPAAPGTGQAG